MIRFELDGAAYVVDSAELLAVTSACPFTTYPGLPEHITGIVHWSGKVLPVYNVFHSANINPKEGTFFICSIQDAPFGLVAVAVPGPVRVFLSETLLPRPESAPPEIVGLAQDADGDQALHLQLHQWLGATFDREPATSTPTKREKNAA
ncbi:MAG: chemotaxis protein CheW [Bdellovibrionota bacterium]